MNESPELTKLPPLETLFEKPKISNPKISPMGRYLIWLERDPTRKVLNFQASLFDIDIGLSAQVESKQLSFFDDYDACVFYTISTDDKYIIFLREPTLGKEMYHLYTIDISKAMCDEEWKSSCWQYECRTPDLSTTCAIGFCGGVQLWTSKSTPDVVRLATGQGAMFWDLSELTLSTNELKLIERNPVQLNTWWKNPTDFVNLVCVIFRTIGNIVGSCVFEKIFHVKNLICPARVPVEWQLDHTNLEAKGNISVSIEMPRSHSTRWFDISSWKPEININWSCLYKRKWQCINTVSMGDMNMHLVGAGGGSGTARMDFINEYTVDVHLCRKGDDFTRYERFDLRHLNKSHTIAQATDSDITGFLRNPDLKIIDAVIYESDKLRISSLMASKEDNDYSRLERAFKFQTGEKDVSSNVKARDSFPSFYPVSRTEDNKIWIVYAYTDRGNQICEKCPEAYFIFRNYVLEGKNLSIWKVPRPLLNEYFESLGTQHTLYVTSRDQVKLLCFLTTPPVTMIKDQKMLPLVVFPHGGPNWRDNWGYDPMTQALSSRGYVVLQVQFRGSTGFGMKFMQDGMEGGCCSTTQRDIVDCVHYILENVVFHKNSKLQMILQTNSKFGQDSNCIKSDPHRTAILGGSFGGYCSLFGVTLLDTAQPRFQYCCGVAFAALYSVGAASEVAFRGDPLVKSYWRQLYGKQISDELDAAKAVSPFYHVNKVKVPLMICHGENDPRCPIVLANAFCEKLSERGLVRYITYKDEGHGLRKEANILHNWKEVLNFLGQRLYPNESARSLETNDCELSHSATIVYD